ncbi:MAG: aspartate/glutamate racemase family protein, partial [Patescibacteria group bacterium]
IDYLIKQYPQTKGRTFRVGLIATRATVHSASYERALKKRHITNIKITSQACPLLVPLIEEGFSRTTAARMIVQSYLRPLKALKIQSLLLACTHYPLIIKLIQSLLGSKTQVIHPGIATAQWLAHAISKNNVAKKEGMTIYTTGDPKRFSEIAARFWKTPITAHHVEIKK